MTPGLTTWIGRPRGSRSNPSPETQTTTAVQIVKRVSTRTREVCGKRVNGLGIADFVRWHVVMVLVATGRIRPGTGPVWVSGYVFREWMPARIVIDAPMGPYSRSARKDRAPRALLLE
jgi:hypothetical protein